MHSYRLMLLANGPAMAGQPTSINCRAMPKRNYSPFTGIKPTMHGLVLLIVRGRLWLMTLLRPRRITVIDGGRRLNASNEQVTTMSRDRSKSTAILVTNDPDGILG